MSGRSCQNDCPDSSATMRLTRQLTGCRPATCPPKIFGIWSETAVCRLDRCRSRGRVADPPPALSHTRTVKHTVAQLCFRGGLSPPPPKDSQMCYLCHSRMTELTGMVPGRVAVAATPTDIRSDSTDKVGKESQCERGGTGVRDCPHGVICQRVDGGKPHLSCHIGDIGRFDPIVADGAIRNVASTCILPMGYAHAGANRSSGPWRQSRFGANAWCQPNEIG